MNGRGEGATRGLPVPEITANLPAVKAPTEALRINEAQSPMRWSSGFRNPLACRVAVFQDRTVRQLSDSSGGKREGRRSSRSG